MEINLTNDMCVELKKELAKKPWGISPERRNYRESGETINMAEYTIDELATLEKMLEGIPHIKGSNLLLRDLQTWVKACTNGAEDAKCRRCAHAPALIKTALIAKNRRHVYTTAGGVAEALLPYYITEVSYYARRDRDDTPEHVEIDTAYEIFGEIRTKSFRLYASQILGRTAMQIITACGLVLETDEIRADYEHQQRRFESLRPRVGAQVLCRGDGSTASIDDFHGDAQRWGRTINCEKNGEPARCVLDVFKESDEADAYRQRGSGHSVSSCWWRQSIKYDKSGNMVLDMAYLDGEKDEATEDDGRADVLVHPYLVVFDLARHVRYSVHVAGVELYVYDTSIRNRLTLPPDHSAVLDTLLSERPEHFVDIIRNKSGGIVVLCQGPPGTGKTLTAEVYAESMKRPLYSVQCSQLGIDAETVESMLMGTLERGKRWGAVMLLDEADVYIHRRGDDLVQNAIVGVFLRVMEYHAGVLFMTTNRGDLVDDAILSRCTARLEYGKPSAEAQARIWHAIASVNRVDLSEETIAAIVAAHPMSGRDIKNVFKLCQIVANDRGQKISVDLVGDMKRFKPTVE